MESIRVHVLDRTMLEIIFIRCSIVLPIHHFNLIRYLSLSAPATLLQLVQQDIILFLVELYGGFIAHLALCFSSEVGLTHVVCR